MKKLICEMCGSVDLLKQDGIFVCQSCGAKYTVEEAKKMMVEVEGKVDVSGSSVFIDRSNELTQLQNLMVSAFDSYNYDEAITYATRILEIDGNNYLAHYVKGSSSGFKSSVANPRLQEATNCWCSAVRTVPAESPEAVNLFEWLNNDLDMIFSGMMSSCFKIYLLEQSTAGATSAYSRFNQLTALKLSTIVSIQATYNERLPQDERNDSAAQTLSSDGGFMPLNEFSKELKAKAENVYSTLNLFKGSNLSNRAQEQLLTHLVWWMSYKEVLSMEDREAGLDACISMYNRTINELQANQFTTSCVYDQLSAIRKEKPKVQEEKQKALRQKETAIREKQEKRRQSRISSYWAEHPERRAELDTKKSKLLEERKSVLEKVEEYDRKIMDAHKALGAESPEDAQKREIQRQIAALKIKKVDLGVFKAKEKKRLDEEISALESKIASLDEIINQQNKEHNEIINAHKVAYMKEKEPFAQKLRELNSMIAEIDKELSMDR